jgi:quinol monooxygenase YgiN
MAELQAIARYRIAAGKEQEVFPLLDKLAEASRTEPGNLSFVVYRALEDERDIVLLERYASRGSFEAHRETQHFKEIVVDQIIPRLDSRVVESYDVAG